MTAKVQCSSVNKSYFNGVKKKYFTSFFFKFFVYKINQIRLVWGHKSRILTYILSICFLSSSVVAETV